MSATTFEVEHVCIVLRVQSVERLYSDALASFPNNALLHMFVAHYLHTYRGNLHAEQLQLSAAEVT